VSTVFKLAQGFPVAGSCEYGNMAMKFGFHEISATFLTKTGSGTQ
jgi:hypothetical protein